MLKNWYIQNPRVQLSSNMYISYCGFYFYAHTAQPMTPNWPLSPNFKNTVFCASCFSSTEVTRSLYYRACTMLLFIGKFYCDAQCSMHVINALFYCQKIFVSQQTNFVSKNKVKRVCMRGDVTQKFAVFRSTENPSIIGRFWSAVSRQVKQQG